MNNLIGISGRAGSGKDTVGSIIQWLTKDLSDREDLDNFEARKEMILRYINQDHTRDGRNIYEIKKFADKLKDMVCLLIGCTRDDLEDHSFKEKELGEEWWYFKSDTKLIPYCEKEMFIIETNLIRKQLHQEPLSITELESLLIKLTPRKLLQLLGTECGREIIHPNAWVNALFADYNEPNKVEVLYNGIVDEEESYTTGSDWIITDVRFPNEAQAIKNLGGITIRVERDFYESDDTPGLEGKVRLLRFNEHPSETALDDYEFDYVIDNNGTIEELINKVKKLNL